MQRVFSYYYNLLVFNKLEVAKSNNNHRLRGKDNHLYEKNKKILPFPAGFFASSLEG
jgi:hypothetical protein